MASQITSRTIVYSTVYSGADQRKHQSSMSLAFVQGNSPVTGEFPCTNGQLRGKCFHLMRSSWYQDDSPKSSPVVRHSCNESSSITNGKSFSEFDICVRCNMVFIDKPNNTYLLMIEKSELILWLYHLVPDGPHGTHNIHAEITRVHGYWMPAKAPPRQVWHVEFDTYYG